RFRPVSEFIQLAGCADRTPKSRKPTSQHYDLLCTHIVACRHLTTLFTGRATPLGDYRQNRCSCSGAIYIKLRLKRSPRVRADAQSHGSPAMRVQPRWRRPITDAPPPVSLMLRPCGTTSVHAQISEPGRLNRIPQLAAFPSESRPTSR